MPALVLMKAFENAPAKYDGAMDLLTLGRVGRIKTAIASRVDREGCRVLDLGCGAGSLAVMMAKRGARVVGIDTSESMLQTAQKRVVSEHLEDAVQVRRLSVMEIDALPSRSFDLVVGTLVLSELSDEELTFVLAEARRLLVPDGELLIADE